MNLKLEIIISPPVERTDNEIDELLKEEDFLQVYKYPLGIELYNGEIGYYKFRRVISKIF